MSDDVLNIELPNASGDNIQLVVRGRELSISVEEPWAGSTETGFGYHCSVNMDEVQAEKIRDFLLKHFPVRTGGDRGNR